MVYMHSTFGCSACSTFPSLFFNNFIAKFPPFLAQLTSSPPFRAGIPLSGVSRSQRVTSDSENVRRGIDVTIMLRAASSTSPLSYSKVT